MGKAGPSHVKERGVSGTCSCPLQKPQRQLCSVRFQFEFSLSWSCSWELFGPSRYASYDNETIRILSSSMTNFISFPPFSFKTSQDSRILSKFNYFSASSSQSIPFSQKRNFQLETFKYREVGPEFGDTTWKILDHAFSQIYNRDSIDFTFAELYRLLNSLFLVFESTFVFIILVICGHHELINLCSWVDFLCQCCAELIYVVLIILK